MSNGTMVTLESPEAVMYAIFDKDGMDLPDAGNLMVDSQKAIYGRVDEAENIKRLSNEAVGRDRYFVVKVNIILVDDITVPVP